MIRTRILAFQIVVALAVLLMIAAGLLAQRNLDRFLAFGAAAHRQLAAISALASDANGYARKVGVLLSSGMGDPAAVAALHSRIALDLARLDRLAREAPVQSGDSAPQTLGLDRVARLQQLYSDMNLKVEALLAMRGAGQHDLAVRIFQTEIDTGLGEDFERVTAEGVAQEMTAIAEADRRAGRLARAMGLGVAITAALVLSAVLAAGVLLYRAMARPIGRLAAGAEALGRGELGSRIGPLGSGEFGLLARSFDDMAGRLESQQRLLLAARTGLEADVLARTAELQDANAELEARDRSRRRFLADISHELRTPLTILRGEAEVALRGKGQAVSEYRDTLGRIVEQAGNLGRLVEDLLALARTESEEIAFLPEFVDLAAVAAEAAREAQVLGQARQVRISMATEAVPTILCDPQRLKQVLMIGLDNAVKYSPRGGAVLVRVRPDAGDATVTIRNRSEHASADELPRLFDRNYRGSAGSSAGGAGSGLGLAIARWMVEKQGGSIGLARVDGSVELSLRFSGQPAQGAEERHAAG